MDLGIKELKSDEELKRYENQAGSCRLRDAVLYLNRY
jgi:hypothetical protein